jgi:hypothetical protein
MTTVAGTGLASSSGDGGMATSATINGPVGVWQDSVGTIYIVEFTGHRVRAVSSSGTISTVAGSGTISSSSTDSNGDYGPVRLSSSYHTLSPLSFCPIRHRPPLSTTPPL